MGSAEFNNKGLEIIMNSALSKKLRKYAAKNYRLNLNDILQTVCSENIFNRLGFAFKVVFKVYTKKPIK